MPQDAQPPAEPGKRKLRPLVLVAVPLLATLALLVVVYMFYVQSRQRYFSERNLRALSVLSEQLEGAIEDLTSAVHNAADQAAKSDPQDPNASFRRIIALTPNLHPAGPRDGLPCSLSRSKLGAVGVCILPHLVRSRQSSVEARPGAGNPMALTSTGDSTLYLCDAKTDVCAKIALSDLLQPLIENSPLDDLHVFLADEQGTVLYERNNSGLQIIRLPSRAGAGAPAGGASSSPPAGTVSGPPPLPPIEDLQRASVDLEVPFSETPQRLFAQPIQLSFGGVEGAALRERTWVVAALVAGDRFKRDARAISFAVMSVVPLLLVIGLLVPPLLKVWTMGPRDRLRAIDVHVVNVALLTLTAIATVLLLDWYAYGRLRGAVDADLQAFSQKLRDNFTAEARQVHQVLADFVQVRLSPTSREGDAYSDQEYALCTSILGRAECAGANGWSISDVAKAKAIAALAAYPYFQMVVLMDRDGWQREKWAVQSTTTPTINVADRSYFRDARNRQLLAFDDSGDSRLAVNLITSRNTGETLVVFSLPVERNGSQKSSGAPIEVATMLISNLVSLVNPVAPPSFGFAVLQSDGTVLFHSNPRRRLYENFFAECDRTSALQAALFAHREAMLDVAYHGRFDRMYIHPLEHTPWSLVVFSDKEIFRTVNLEIVATSLVLFVLCVFGYALVVLVVRLLRPGDHAGWLWPDHHRPAVYRSCGLSLAGLVAWFGWAVHRYDPAQTLMMTGALPLVALAAIFLRLNPGEEMNPGRRWLSWSLLVGSGTVALAASLWSGDLIGPVVGLVALAALLTGRQQAAELMPTKADRAGVAYVGMALALLLLLAVLPAVALYKDAFAQGMETLARLGQYQLAEALAARAERVTKQYGSLGKASLVQDRLRDTRDVPVSTSSQFLPYPDPVPPKCPLPAQPPGSSTGTDDLLSVVGRHFSGLIMAFLPIYNDESGQLREMIYRGASDGRWRWCAEDDGRASLQLIDTRFAPESSQNAEASQTVRTRIQRLSLPPFGVGALTWLLFGLFALGVAFWLLRALASRLLGLDIADDPPAAGKYSETAVGRFYLRPERETVARLLDGAHEVDLRAKDPEKWTQDLPWDRSKRVVVTHLEHRPDDRVLNQRKLALLEKLVCRDNPVDVVSELDPLAYFCRRIQSPGDPATAENYVTAEELNRWAEVLSRLEKVRSDLPSRPPRSEIERTRLERTLRQECEWTAELRGIRKQVQADPRWHGLTEEELIRHVGDLAEPHYRVLWSRCSDGERLVLIHLATEGFVNPRNWDIVRRLMRRRLIRRTPAFRVMNRSFAWFIAQVEHPSQVEAWESAAGASSWDRVRNLVIASVVIAGLFLFVTQPDVLAKWLGFLTALAGGTGALMQLLGFFQAAKTTARSKS